jgi:hypothetical protein
MVFHLGSAAQVLEPASVRRCEEALLVHLKVLEWALNLVHLAQTLEPWQVVQLASDLLLLRPLDRLRPTEPSSGVKKIRVQICPGSSRTMLEEQEAAKEHSELLEAQELGLFRNHFLVVLYKRVAPHGRALSPLDSRVNSKHED